MATRAQLRTRARERADQDSATFPTDTQYNTWLDESAKEVWYDLIGAGWPINFSTVDKTPTGSSFIALGVSGTVAFIQAVFRKDSANFYELARMEEGRRASLMSLTGDSEYYQVRIDPTTGPGVELFPTPVAGLYRVQYILEHPGFSGDSDPWYGPARSDELIVLRTAEKGVRKEGNSGEGDELNRAYSKVMESVTNMASWFDMRNSAKIRDVRPLSNASRDPFDHLVVAADY